jgi:hypothetical protein
VANALQPATGPASVLGGNPRLGRALFYLHQQVRYVTQPVVRAKLGQLIAAGDAMDYAVRLRGHGDDLTPELAAEFAVQVGFPDFRLHAEVLPKLKAADLIDYQTALDGTGIRYIQEFVGLSGRVIDQAMRLLELYGPSSLELAVLHSTEIATWAPLTQTQHAEMLSRRGFRDQEIAEAIKLSFAAGVNYKVYSPELREEVIYNPNVWGAQSADIAGFLKSLPPAERDSLLGMCEQASYRPGLALSRYTGFSGSILTSARKVGLIQAATVRSAVAGTSPQTYVFSPLIEAVDDQLISTEALHERKLFVAHILYGHEKAISERGRIADPRVLVGSLLRRGRVGPASNIATDYLLPEASGIVAVRPSSTRGRAYLEVVKRDVVEGGLAWLDQALGDEPSGEGADVGELRPPTTWNGPEGDRAGIADEGAAAEITTSAILRLRKAREEAQRAARFDF